MALVNDRGDKDTVFYCLHIVRDYYQDFSEVVGANDSRQCTLLAVLWMFPQCIVYITYLQHWVFSQRSTEGYIHF